MATTTVLIKATAASKLKERGLYSEHHYQALIPLVRVYGSSQHNMVSHQAINY